jgi:hypothetical protein
MLADKVLFGKSLVLLEFLIKTSPQFPCPSKNTTKPQSNQWNETRIEKNCSENNQVLSRGR